MPRASKSAGKTAGPEFTPFPEPVGDPQDGQPLVKPGPGGYVCTGCDGKAGLIPDGQVLRPQVRDGMVVGLVARGGLEADAPISHECGERV